MIKRVVSVLLVVVILMSFPCMAFGELEEAVYTERKSRKSERFLWDELSRHSPDDAVTAAVLSYFWRESQYRSDSVAGWGMSLAGYGVDLCGTITEKTDKGLEDGSSRDYFIKKARWHGGYGLGQWYRMDYVEGLYDFAQESGMSIGDARMQCEYVFYSMKKDEDLWRLLKRCDDPEYAGYLVAVLYDGSHNGSDYIKQKAVKLYNKYHEGD